ncbi:MAG TPA: ABC transporter permease [Tepidisphaeraceae bacterium]|nr:ABC transporter permease [Tepidisphaeraceae bacterium]
MNRLAPQAARTSVEAAPSIHETVIEPTRGWIGVNWKELYDGRELLFFLIWRDLKVRYKQTILGVLWVVIQPVTNMILYTLVFGSAAGFNKRLQGHPELYGVFVYSALLPWQLFASAMSSGGMSLVNQQNIVKKIYFPRLYVPTSAVGGALVDMGISFVMVMILVLWNHVPISPMLLFLPFLTLMTLLNGLGAAYLLAALTVKYRDFRFLIPFMTQILMFASFVVFPPSLLGNSKWKWALLFNPMYGVVAGFRKCILPLPDQSTGFDWRYVASSLVGGTILFFLGIFVFRRTERTFADIA